MIKIYSCIPSTTQVLIQIIIVMWEKMIVLVPILVSYYQFFYLYCVLSKLSLMVSLFEQIDLRAAITKVVKSENKNINYVNFFFF